jgi:hypothetical protein
MVEQGRGPVHVIADIESLDLVRVQLGRLRDDLADAAVRVDPDPTSTGGTDVARAVNQFVDGWRDGRERIDEKLGMNHQLLTYAIDSYVQVETLLGNAAGGQTTDGGPDTSSSRQPNR